MLQTTRIVFSLLILYNTVQLNVSEILKDGVETVDTKLDKTEVAPTIDKTEVTPTIDKAEVTPTIDKAEVTPKIDQAEVTPTKATAESISENKTAETVETDMAEPGTLESWPEYLPDEKECPQMYDRILNNPQVPWGVSGRAWLTIPPEIEVRRSTIPGAGYGAFSRTFLSSNVWLTEYEGEILPEDISVSSYNYDYAWEMYRADSYMYCIDGANIDRSNWLRWINCARTLSELNIDVMFCYGKIYYRTIKDMYPGQELLVYYGYEYTLKLGINATQFEPDMDDSQ